MAGLGHNNGPTLESGQSWRTHVWKQARMDLLPKLPIEVVRLRVKRAQALGLPYKTYAGIRASSGHDLVGFLFSSNALGVITPHHSAPPAVVEKLDSLVQCRALGLAHRRIDLSAFPGLDAIADAPHPHLTWAALRDHLKAVVRMTGQPADRFILVGEPAFERDWSEAVQAAGFLRGSTYFAHAS